MGEPKIDTAEWYLKTIKEKQTEETLMIAGLKKMISKLDYEEIKAAIGSIASIRNHKEYLVSKYNEIKNKK